MQGAAAEAAKGAGADTVGGAELIEKVQCLLQDTLSTVRCSRSVCMCVCIVSHCDLCFSDNKGVLPMDSFYDVMINTSMCAHVADLCVLYAACRMWCVVICMLCVVYSMCCVLCV